MKFLLSILLIFGIFTNAKAFIYNLECKMKSGDNITIKVFGRYLDSNKILVNNKYTVWKVDSFSKKLSEYDDFKTEIIIYKNDSYTYKFHHYEPEDREYIYIENKWGKKDNGTCYADRL